VTVDPTGQFAYVANEPGVSAYTIEGTTGALTEIDGSPFHAETNPSSVTTSAGPPPAAP
jgi:6-phosphogluconolactonase (cycloisomerase 2 family)